MISVPLVELHSHEPHQKATNTAHIIHGSSHKEDETVGHRGTTVWLSDFKTQFKHLIVFGFGIFWRLCTSIRCVLTYSMTSLSWCLTLGLYFRSFRYWLWDLKLAMKNVKWTLMCTIDSRGVALRLFRSSTNWTGWLTENIHNEMYLLCTINNHTIVSPCQSKV